MKTFLSSLLVFVFFSNCFAQQQPVEVIQFMLTVNRNSTEALYYGFEKGDQIIFSLQALDTNPFKKVQIIEYPGTSRFTDYQTTSIANKHINVDNKAVYIFKIQNHSLIKSRTCSIQIQRIPASEATKNFNTAVKWITKQDNPLDKTPVTIDYISQ